MPMPSGPPNLPPTTRHGIEIAPPASVASPHGIDAPTGQEIVWWTPTWNQVFTHLGWRWLWFTPAAAIVVMICLLPLYPRYWMLLVQFWKLVVMIVVLPTGMALRAMKSVVRHRKEPFCIHCGYSLRGLPDGHRCPECGMPFTFATIDEYRRDPHWFIQRWKQRHEIPPTDVPFSAGAVRRKKSRDGT